jgi:hypothetical protein
MTKAAFITRRPRGLLPGMVCAALALPAAAQEAGDAAGPGGVQLTFGLALRVESTENADLDPVSAGRSDRASAALSFGLTSETAISTLSLDGGVQILGTDGPTSAADGVTNPSLSLAYARAGANADLSLSASWREADLTQDREVDDFDTGGGTRRSTTLALALNWGTAAPLGFGLTAGLSDVAYQDSPGNVDSQTRRLGLTMRADLNEVLSLTGGLRGSRFEEAGGVVRDTVGLDLGLNLARPNGEMGLTLSHDVTEDGDRQSLRFSHSLELPRGTLGYNLGVSRDVAGNLHPVAGIDWQQQLPRGQIGLSYDRSVTANNEDEETLRDKLSFDFGTELTASTRLNLGLALARQENTLSGLTTTNTDVTASLSHDLTPDWALDLGYVHRIRDEDASGEATSDKIYLELRRNFSFRF